MIGYETLKLVEEMTRRGYTLAFMGGPGQTYEARFFKVGESPYGWAFIVDDENADPVERVYIAVDPEDAIRGAGAVREPEFRWPGFREPESVWEVEA